MMTKNRMICVADQATNVKAHIAITAAENAVKRKCLSGMVVTTRSGVNVLVLVGFVKDLNVYSDLLKSYLGIVDLVLYEGGDDTGLWAHDGVGTWFMVSDFSQYDSTQSIRYITYISKRDVLSGVPQYIVDGLLAEMQETKFRLPGKTRYNVFIRAMMRSGIRPTSHWNTMGGIFYWLHAIDDWKRCDTPFDSKFERAFLTKVKCGDFIEQTFPLTFLGHDYIYGFGWVVSPSLVNKMLIYKTSTVARFRNDLGALDWAAGKQWNGQCSTEDPLIYALTVKLMKTPQYMGGMALESERTWLQDHVSVVPPATLTRAGYYDYYEKCYGWTADLIDGVIAKMTTKRIGDGSSTVAVCDFGPLFSAPVGALDDVT
jgi:hypothetical protein